MKGIKHVVIVLAALFVCLGIPGLCYFDGFQGGADAVSSASMELPDQPSGDFLVLLNTEKHGASLDDWDAFFHEREVGVIFEDLSCLTMAGDVTGEQLAERYMARLAENQMTITSENPTLVASRAEAGAFDVVIVSKEMAEAMQLNVTDGVNHTAVLTVEGASA